MNLCNHQRKTIRYKKEAEILCFVRTKSYLCSTKSWGGATDATRTGATTNKQNNAMQQKTYTIVGLRHHAWQGEGLDRRLSQAEGKRVVLTHDDDNEWNREATLAWIDIEMVGHVKNDQCHEATEYCRLMGEHRLQGRVTHVDVEHRRLTVTVGVRDGLTVSEQADDDDYDQWTSQADDVPELERTHDEKRLAMLQYDLAALLTEDAGLDDTLRRELEAFEQLTPLDVSREATQYRRRITTLMLHSRHDDVRRWGRRMDVAVTAMGAPETGELMASYLCRELPDSRGFRDLMVRHRDLSVERLEQQLRNFPHRLYDEYRVSPATFMAKLYYRMVPARALRRFLTGLLMAEQMRGQLNRTVSQEQALGDVLDYVAQIDHCAAPQWQGLTRSLWQRIAAQYRQRLLSVNGAKGTTFNRRFTCQVVGTLLQLGVYRRDVRQTEYTCLLEGSRQSSLRKNINQGVDDDETRLSLRQLTGGARC